jgi:hypothetical protein
MRARIAKKLYHKLVHAYHADKFGDYERLPFEFQMEIIFKTAPMWRKPRGFCGTRPSDEIGTPFRINPKPGGGFAVAELHMDSHGTYPDYRLGSYKKLYQIAKAELAAWRKEQCFAGQGQPCAAAAQG